MVSKEHPKASQNAQEQLQLRSSKAALSSSEAVSVPQPSVKQPTTIEALPNELLSTIIAHFDCAPPSASETVLRDEPILDLTQSEVTNLKSISCVSKRWRTAVLPILFKHSQLIIREPRGRRATLEKRLTPFNKFIVENKLRKVVITFTLLVHDKKIASNSFSERHMNGLSSFWSFFFEVIDPLVLLIVAPSEALGSLAYCHVVLEDVWCYDCPCQYLRLERPPTKAATEALPVEPPTLSVKEAIQRQIDFRRRGHNRSISGAPSSPGTSSTAGSSRQSMDKHISSSPLFQYREWTKLLLNEGSFIRAYATYEFWLRKTPSILADLVGGDTPPRKPIISQSVRDMEYISIFPVSTHFGHLTKHIPRLDRLYVQFVPRNEILQNPKKMQQVQQTDLWQERNSCYALLMREILASPPVDNYKYLKSFESGDAADRDAWEMAVEFVKRSTNSTWRVAEEGVFVRDIDEVVDVSGEDGEVPSLFSSEGSLVRWAFNGTAVLPVSASTLYGRPAWNHSWNHWWISE